MNKIKKILILLAITFTISCQQQIKLENQLSIITLVNRNGVTETINNKERLKQLENTDFTSPQPYKKVLRIYKKDSQGNVPGILTSYHNNGQQYQHLSILNGRANGYLNAWYPNGKKMFSTTVIEGTPDIDTEAEKSWIFENEAKAWSEKGNLIAHFNYSKGRLEGTTTYYHPSGSIKETKPYLQGNIDGFLTSYYTDGSIYKKTTYKKNTKEGNSITYWNNGAVSATENFKENKLIEGSYYTHNNQLISSIYKGVGTQIYLCENQTIHKIEYHNGVIEGSIQEFNQKNELIHCYHEKNGLKDGKEELFFANTQNKMLSIQWKKGKIHGITQTWYPNGNIESQKELSENKKSGLNLAWYENGQLMLIEEYENNFLLKGEYFEKGSNKPISRIIAGNGIATLFDKNGVLLQKTNYENALPQ
jgi:antitoxin component YwqK of YwqJK toxin-antitoxin module